jgi:hypothetical protein
MTSWKNIFVISPIGDVFMSFILKQSIKNAVRRSVKKSAKLLVKYVFLEDITEDSYVSDKRPFCPIAFSIPRPGCALISVKSKKPALYPSQRGHF